MLEIEFLNYPREIELSSARRKKYYIKNKNTPKAKKYQDSSKYGYKKFKNGKEYLIDLSTGEPVIANPKAAGTPNMQRINGQDVWAGMQPHTRSRIAANLHKYFSDKLKGIKVEFTKPIEVIVEIHDTILSGTSVWDVDNRALIYNKVFMDCLTQCNLIKDDSNLFVVAPPAPHFVPINVGDTPKLVYIIKETSDERVLNFYKNLPDFNF